MSDLAPHQDNRTFLVVVDDSTEMQNALYYACRRAHMTGGRVALLYVIEPGELQSWASVQHLLQEERRQQAEQLLQRYAGVVHELTGHLPVLHIREGNRRDELMSLIEEDKDLSILVLGAATGSDGPGPLIAHLVHKAVTKLRIPLVIVPGWLTPDQLDQVT